MSESIEFGSSGGSRVRFYEPERHPGGGVEYFSVEAGDQSASARLRVYAYEASHLAALFEDMVREWRGWSGEKIWHSPERECELSATADGKGHVAVRIRLMPSTSSLTPPWRFECTVLVEAGELDRVASAIRSFVDGPG